MQTKYYDDVIIGGGIHGRATAAELAPHYNVVLLEQYGSKHTRGSSHGLDRMTRPSSGEGKIYNKMYKIATERFEELAQKTQLEILRNGNGFLAADMTGRPNPMNWLFANSEICDSNIVMRGHELNARDAYFNLREDAVVIMQPGLRQIAAANAMEGFRKVAENAGAEFRFHTPVVNIDYKNKSVTLANGETIHAGKIVIAAGSWINQVLDDRCQLKVTIEQHDVAYFPLTGHLNRLPPAFAYEKASDAVYYGMPSGGFMKLGNHSHVSGILQPGQRCRSPDELGVKLLSSFVRENLRNVNPEPAKIETCKYTKTKDTHFRIGPHTAHPDIIIVSACSGHGFKFAPAVAMAVRDWIDGTDCGFDKEFFGIGKTGIRARLAAELAAPLPPLSFK